MEAFIERWSGLVEQSRRRLPELTLPELTLPELSLPELTLPETAQLQAWVRTLPASGRRILGRLAKQAGEGVLPLEYLVAGGVLLALAVLGLLYRRSRLQAVTKARGGRPEPEGREEPRVEGRAAWRKPTQPPAKTPVAPPAPAGKGAGWFGSKAESSKKEPVAAPPPAAWRRGCSGKPPEQEPTKKATVQPGKFQLSKPLETVAAKEAEATKKAGWFGSSSGEVKREEAVRDSTKKEEAPKKAGWFGSKSTDDSKKCPEKKSWQGRANVDEDEEQRKFEAELAEVERAALDNAKSFMKPVRLNIEKNPRSIVESKAKKEREVALVKQICGEVKNTVRLDEKAAAAREEKVKDMETVRSARSFFKSVDKQRSMSAVPRIRFRTDEEVSDSYSRGNGQRLSQFQPGKIHSKFSDIFGQASDEGGPSLRPPKKKLITLDEVIRPGEGAVCEDPGVARALELRAVAAARRSWLEEEEELPRSSSSAAQEELSSLQTTPVKARYKPVGQEAERPQSMELHNELNELRESRPTPLAKRWRPAQEGAARSQSANPAMRTRLPDSSWVVERAASRLEEERQKAVQELEEVKRARLETMEGIEASALERPSSSTEVDSRYRTLKELEEVRKVHLAHDRRVQESYSQAGDQPSGPAKAAKEEMYRETIQAQRARRAERTAALKAEMEAVGRLRAGLAEPVEELHGRRLQQEEVARRAQELAALAL